MTEPIAVKLGQKQKEVSVAEFFERNRHLLGFDNKKKALLTVVREAVDNSLDAAEEARILPEIKIEIIDMGNERFKVIVEDNGPGIVKKQIPNVFAKLLYGSKFHSMKQSLTADEPVIFYKDNKIEIKPIGDLVDSLIGQEDIKDVTDLNILVPAFDHETKLYSWKNVSHVIKHKRENEIVKIKTNTGRTIKVTGCHSLFTYNNSTQRIEEIEARSLKKDSYILAPKSLPVLEEIKEINLLNYLKLESVKNLWIYVYDIDKEFIKLLFSKAEVIHKVTSKSRKFYRFNKPDKTFVDVLDDSAKQYLTKGFLPLKLVLELGLQNQVKDCVLQTYYHGKLSRIPISWQINSAFMRFLGLFVAEGHIDVRQVGFTFGLHEDYFVDEITQTARLLGSNVTIERRDRSYRVKVFGGIISLLLNAWCGRGAHNKRIPEFIFRVSKGMRQEFLDALYQGDGHKFKKRNCLTLSTVSKNLSNDLLYLWLMQGVLATIRESKQQGLGKNPSMVYVVNIYGEDLNKSNIFKPNANLRWKHIYKEIIQESEGELKLLHKQEHLCLLKIREIEIINEGYEYVYDLSVPKAENFVGGIGGISCHNSRGQQGIGVSAAVLYAQLTTGRPAKITSKIGKGYPAVYMELGLDTKNNKPEIKKEEEVQWEKEHGVKIELDLEATYQKGDQSVDTYLKYTSIVNPHATIIYTTPKAEQFIFARATEQLPVEPKEIKPHPYGVEHGILGKMLANTETRTLQSFLTTEFSRVGPGTAKEICEKAALLSNMKPQEVTHQQVEKLMQGIKDTKIISPPTDCISPITSELLEKGLKKEVNAEFYATVTRTPEVYKGIPFVIEAGIAYGGDQPADQSIKIIRYANRVPLLYKQGDCASFNSVLDINWRPYGLQQSSGNTPQGPVTLVIHMASVWPPFTSEAKEAIAGYPEILKEMKLALQECGRKLGSYVNKKRRLNAESQKRSYIEKYIPYVSEALQELLDLKKGEVEKTKQLLKEILEKHRGKLEKMEMENAEYDEEFASIGKEEKDE